MKSIRLNKELRAEIISNIRQAYTIKNKEPVLPDPKKDLLITIEDIYRKRAKAIEDKVIAAGLTKEYLKKSHYFNISINGETFSNHFRDASGSKEYLTQVNPTTSYLFTDDNLTDKECIQAVKIYKAARKKERPLRQKRSEWVKVRNNYIADVVNVLAGVNTTGQLLEVWPEVEKFLPKGITDPSSINLPAVSINQLNKLI